MTLVSSFSLFGAIFLLAITPGVGVFAIVSMAMASGFYQAFLMIIGLILGDIIYLLFAIYGLGGIASLMGEFFIVLKYLSGIYLIYLGYTIFTAKAKIETENISQKSWHNNFLSGLFITLANPKVIFFYLGFLPAFLNLTQMTNLDIFIVVCIVAFTLALVILTYAYLASKSKEIFKSVEAMKNINRSSGALMIIAGSILVFRTF